MSNINNLIFEALFRARGLAQKLRPSVIAYKLIHKTLPLKNIVANTSTSQNKLFNKRLFDSNLNPEWLNRLFNSPHVPADFDISGGFDQNNVAFISFKTNLTPQLKSILQELHTIPNVYIDITNITPTQNMITIAGNIWYDEHHLIAWENWFDSVTSILEDKRDEY